MRNKRWQVQDDLGTFPSFSKMLLELSQMLVARREKSALQGGFVEGPEAPQKMCLTSFLHCFMAYN